MMLHVCPMWLVCRMAALLKLWHIISCLTLLDNADLMPRLKGWLVCTGAASNSLSADAAIGYCTSLWIPSTSVIGA